MLAASMAKNAARPVAVLVSDAMKALGMTQEQFGYALGASLRTAQRWATGRATPYESNLRILAKLLHPTNRPLAVEIAAHIHETLETLGIETPTPATPSPVVPPQVPPSPPRPPTNLVVESVVCAAADTLQMPPGGVREALRSAFARARALGLTVAEVDEALSPAQSASEAARKRAPR
jgi:hypothetical protein